MNWKNMSLRFDVGGKLVVVLDWRFVKWLCVLWVLVST